MKKLFALVLTVLLLASMAPAVYAGGTTTLTTTVPQANYTLIIPADQTIEFNDLFTELTPMVNVEDASGFAVGKNLKVTITYEPFKAEGVTTTIPFKLKAYETTPDGAGLDSGDYLTFKGQENGTVGTMAYPKAGTPGMPAMGVSITAENWGKALAGQYKAVLNFTAEVVAG